MFSTNVPKDIMKEEQIEKFLEKWGAEKELNHKKYPLPVLVSIGYRIGKQWASNQKRGDLLSRFEAFYTDWTNNHLTNQRYKMLYEELDPASVIAEMSDILTQALVDPHVAAQPCWRTFICLKMGLSGALWRR